MARRWCRKTQGKKEEKNQDGTGCRSKNRRKFTPIQSPENLIKDGAPGGTGGKAGRGYQDLLKKNSGGGKPGKQKRLGFREESKKRGKTNWTHIRREGLGYGELPSPSFRIDKGPNEKGELQRTPNRAVRQGHRHVHVKLRIEREKALRRKLESEGKLGAQERRKETLEEVEQVAEKTTAIKKRIIKRGLGL